MGKSTNPAVICQGVRCNEGKLDRFLSRRSILQIFFASAALPTVSTLSACTNIEYYDKLRYRLSLTFDVNGVPRSGSSVVEIQPIDQSGGGAVYMEDQTGAATVVDFGDDRVLLALLEGPRPWGQRPSLLFGDLYGIERGDDDNERALNLRLSRMRGTKPLSPEQLPTMIVLSDKNDPSNYEVVDPLDMAATLGGDGRLVLATVEITDAPITKTIKRELPWVNKKMLFLNHSIQTRRSGGKQPIQKFNVIRGI